MNESNLTEIKNDSLSINYDYLSMNSEGIVNQITRSLGIERTILPLQQDVNKALEDLPRELQRIPVRLRDQFIAKSCVAISVGLFDGAIVYIWNSVINELRTKVNYFGIEMIKNISGVEKDDNFLDKINDSELLELCYQLNIISKQGYFYLNQCRETRNHASIAHPTEIEIDDRELINFISRCCKYGLSDTDEIVGIDMKMFIGVLENQESTKDSLVSLSEMISNTFESQKELVIQILYSKYTDESNASHIRSNSLQLAKLLKDILSNKMIVSLIKQHSEILIKGNDSRSATSRKFFEELGLLSSLKDNEKIAIFKKATDNLRHTHFSFNNFHNEPPFAERLYEISLQITPVPEVIIEEYVSTILCCFLGNDYGVSTNAMQFYRKMLKDLTPKGIEVLLDEIEHEITNNYVLKKKFKKDLLIELLDYYRQSEIVNADQKNKLATISKNHFV
ncbi:MAG: hypothetical protein Q4F01_03880 [Staphylococcus rostri]|uniref:hypothetical protein n=1 Tax=Staphylococcus rostri TaxID=522262 RepID=UPI0026E0B215|nr:hypothetical protein [Staphylococcus rostri]MDO5375305.1 hypothetical protein [Staphylococcus rostri]